MNDYQTWGYTYRKGRGYYEPLLSNESDDNKRGIAKLIRRLDKKAQMEYEIEHKNGYCPKCHCLIRLNGKCDNCD